MNRIVALGAPIVLASAPGAVIVVGGLSDGSPVGLFGCGSAALAGGLAYRAALNAASEVGLVADPRGPERLSLRALSVPFRVEYARAFGSARWASAIRLLAVATLALSAALWAGLWFGLP